jgi:hypothetical protein
MHDSRMFGVKSQQHQQQQLLLGYCPGGKKLLWRLPCLCLVAAIFAFTLGFFTAPFVGSARSAVAVRDPLWQMYYTRHKGSTSKPAVRNGGLQQFQQQEAEEAEIEEEEEGGDFKLQPREADLQFGKQGDSVQIQQRRQGSHETQGPLDLAAVVVEPALESDKHEEETCDLFTGAWVEDNSPPLYTNENCPIVTQTQNCPGNGRPDSNYLNWRWQPQGCDLPAFDAKAFLELMRGKTLAFVGDSVARNQYESLLCMLWQVNFLVTSFFHSNLLLHLPIMSGMLRYSSSSHHKLGLQGLSSIYAFIFVEIRGLGLFCTTLCSVIMD